MLETDLVPGFPCVIQLLEVAALTGTDVHGSFASLALVSCESKILRKLQIYRGTADFFFFTRLHLHPCQQWMAIRPQAPYQCMSRRIGSSDRESSTWQAMASEQSKASPFRRAR